MTVLVCQCHKNIALTALAIGIINIVDVLGQKIGLLNEIKGIISDGCSSLTN